MTDPVLPLGGARFDGAVSVQEIGPLGTIVLRGDLSKKSVVKAATKATGAAMPTPLTGTGTAEGGLLWMAPDELALLLPHARVAETIEALAADLKRRHALVADVSDARAHFTLTGDDGTVRDVLAKLAAVDFDPAQTPPGTLRRTRLAQTAAGIWLRETGVAQVFTFRSVARYTFDLLSHAADPAARVRYFAR
jgi:sarcosine oxidase subunit gamma